MRYRLPLAALTVCLVALVACQNNSAPPPPAGQVRSISQPAGGPARTTSGNPLSGMRSAAVPPPRDTRKQPENMLLGNPDNATGDSENHDHYLMLRKQYALSYNDSWRFPNWVGWHLSRTDIGNTERGQFRPDPDLPDGFMHVTTGDYTNSGYDRGHNCPSKDRSASREDNDIVFYMTNITPQQHGMNAGPWEQFESYCRDLTGQGNELYIYCGHAFDGPKGKTIGKARIAVPDFGWKIAVVLPERSGDDLSRITPDTRVIALRMPNISTISNQDWRKYKTSVGEIEQATGLHFFATLPPDVAAKLKGKTDFDPGGDPIRGGGGGGRPSRTMRERAAEPQPPPSSESGGAAGQVWVNTKSGAYWLPGTQYYGKTKQGKYLSEQEAIQAGYHKAGGQ